MIPMRTSRLIFGIVALSLASTSCIFRQKAPPPRVFIPPPTRPAATAQAKAAPLPDAPQLAVDLASVAPPQLPEITTDTLPEMPDAPRRAAHRTPPAVAPPKPQPTEVAAPEPVAPKLAQMLTPEQQRENTKVLDESLERVNRNLAILEGKNLTPAQKEEAERIRAFQKQAEQAREQDLLTAVSLARRADLLAKDLLERLP